MTSNQLTHLDSDGNAAMVDVGDKAVTHREARAGARVAMQPETLQLIVDGEHRKGDVFTLAKVAGIQAAKRTSDLIPLCHPLMLTKVDLTFTVDRSNNSVSIESLCRVTGQTGVEMEALTAAAGAALNVVDMGKSLNPQIVIESLQVVEKHGGKTGPSKQPDNGPSVAILAVSDSRSAGANEDAATPMLAEAAEQFLGANVIDKALVPDEHTEIVNQLRQWVTGPSEPELILTTGGTGLASRDVTPEATTEVIERPHPGLLELARARCLPGLPHAYLSRAVAGVAGRSLIVNLPGSPRGAVDTLRLMSDVLPHALETLTKPDPEHP